ncbi:bifunctional [glutamine synthetase] adenylyltransferase/[glutamine synthetase]-adenylyl-L-tyrosine phosphorylase [Frankia sp. AgPm24]|uniref:bifunctional [glutamine synthetase] adenylyltransferase/[glutamine synthetase]-adenylyl-L-tyrosine phosphorylase n=1 Tax=Frankia sp. AgPm24 TaxID=631128 RepID=UPI00201014E1|nr:bifunctional [glutamine synthetase] adenylyltransferase/[glutamine synthetase]-adenylyl-L-tyrosine phosphorylase [Frankia sp. AgPm24]MCK9925234.1 bifunctional [glutamine synthetase] adenylyltransferase/[glutamine synthetase]-adenylyl-L-tyrosine phosphorylase [Frankia sp. AgPm24]
MTSQRHGAAAGGIDHPRGSSVGARLARLGFTDVDRVAAAMRRLALLPADGTGTGAGAGGGTGAGGGGTDAGAGGFSHPVVAALAASADPDLALGGLERLIDALGPVDGAGLLAGLAARRGLRERLCAVLGASRALGDHLARRPGDWQVLDADDLATGRPDAARTRAMLLRAVGADPDAPTPRAAADTTEILDELRLAYRRELLTVAARDLTGAVALDDATAELADLAGAAVDAALAIARAGLPAESAPVRLAVIGMGKCGGRELNYVSDVDVVFVAEPPNVEADTGAGPDADADADADAKTDAGAGDGLEATLRTAARLAEGLVRAAGLVTSVGALFQVDTNLRPEGRDGALVRTLESHLTYYRRWARTWEFQALLKARPIAGDRDLGDQFCARVAPLVWTASARPNFVADVQAMRRRVESTLSRAEADRNLKLGPGGLRDVEFAVQLLQLVHGRADPKLRENATLAALDGLVRGGYVGRRDAAALADAYRFLRTAEHRLQLRNLRRVHTLPRGEPELRWLARSMGMRTAAEFEATRTRIAHTVRSMHERLFYQPLLEAVARLSTEEIRLSHAEAAQWLTALGFVTPQRSLRHIEALTSGVSRTAAIQRHLLPTLLPTFADGPAPDAGLLAYRQVSEALGRVPWYLRLLRDSVGAADRLARVLATSPYVADLMAQAPESVRLLRTEADLVPVSREALSRTLLAIVHRNPDSADAVGRGRAVRRVELVRVACADLLGLLDVVAVGRALSDAAAATITASLLIAQRRVAGGDPDRLPARMAVIAMGRLGGDEMSYVSDADVVFVHAPRDGHGEQEAGRAAAAVVGELHRLLSLPGPDPALRLDTALRPEGRSGPLTRTLEAYEAYYRRWSRDWESQALLRARPLAGDPELAYGFCRLIDAVRYPQALPATALAEIVRLRGRMRRERVPRGVDPRRHLKFGPGGLTDVEWAVQVLQLRYARALPSLRTTSTLDGLRAAVRTGLLGEGDAGDLQAAWLSAARIRGAGTLAGRRDPDLVPTDPREAERTARAAGWPAGGGADLFAEHQRLTGRADRVVQAIFAREQTAGFG